MVSDWGGLNSTVQSIKAGCDIEFPFSNKWRFEKLINAINQGELTVGDIDQAAENVLTLIRRVRGEDMSDEEPEKEANRAETRALIRDAGVQGLTLLKNAGSLLPIKADTTKVAVIGPNANRAIAGGGGSASLNPYYNTLPLDSIQRVSHQKVIYAQGCHTNKWLPVATKFCRTKFGEPGVEIDWFAGDKFEGAPVLHQVRTNTDLFLWDSAPLEHVGSEWSAVASTYLIPTTTGRHTISFMSVGPGKLYIDGKLALDLWNWTEEGEAMFDGSIDCLVEIDMQAGTAAELRVEMTNELRPIAKQKQFNMTHKYGGCRIGFQEEDKTDYLQEAVEAAKIADVAIVIVGLDAEWESEGYDRQTMDLPSDGSQDRLVEAVLEANPKTVVVNQSGSPVTMPWADRVPAILQAWYQGQETGNALADVLFGLKNPSGKLPVSFSRRRPFRKSNVLSAMVLTQADSSYHETSAHFPDVSKIAQPTTTGLVRISKWSMVKVFTSATGTMRGPRLYRCSPSGTASRIQPLSTVAHLFLTEFSRHPGRLSSSFWRSATLAILPALKRCKCMCETRSRASRARKRSWWRLRRSG